MNTKTIVIASDSFKGSLSSIDICNLFIEELKNKKNVNLITFAIADGGEGSLDSISSIIDGKFIEVIVNDLYFNKIKAKYYVDINNNVYIESASVVGLNLAHINNNPGLVSSYGIGELIKDSINKGYKNIYIFLGGTASNDGGAGIASALGTKFYNKENEEFIPVGLTLKDIDRIDNYETNKLIKDINITILSDVKNVFYGPSGAAYVFAKQKGAKDNELRLLDDGLIHLNKISIKDLNKDASNVLGAGAAGGIGGGLYLFANAKILGGIDTLLDLMNFENIIKNADLIISGEGKLDSQTLDGKVVDGIAKRCIKHAKNLDLIVGICDINLSQIQAKYGCIKHLYETNFKHLPFEQIKATAKEDYIVQIKNLLKDNNI